MARGPATCPSAQVINSSHRQKKSVCLYVVLILFSRFKWNFMLQLRMFFPWLMHISEFSTCWPRLYLSWKNSLHLAVWGSDNSRLHIQGKQIKLVILCKICNIIQGMQQNMEDMLIFCNSICFFLVLWLRRLGENWFVAWSTEMAQAWVTVLYHYVSQKTRSCCTEPGDPGK